MIIAWLAAANPFRRSRTREQALMAARWSSLALILSAAVSLLQVLFMWIDRDRTITAMRELMETLPGSVAAGAPNDYAEMQAAIMEGMMPGMIIQSMIWTVLFAFVFLGLATEQWRRPTRWIPIVFMALAGLALFSYIANAMLAPAFERAAITLPDGSPLAMPGPELMGVRPWLFTVTVIEAAISFVLHITGLRGATALHRIAGRGSASG